MDFADFADTISLFEDVFGTTLPEDLGISSLSSREIVEFLELRLLGWGPNREARALLKKLAEEHNNLQLAEGLQSDWRREQIEAVVREMLRRLSR